MKDLSLENHANEWASDAIPLHRDENGLGCFYRRDLAAAFIGGFQFAGKVTPAEPSGHGEYDPKKAAAVYRELLPEYCFAYVDKAKIAVEAAFLAGSRWANDRFKPEIEAKPDRYARYLDILEVDDETFAALADQMSAPDRVSAYNRRNAHKARLPGAGEQ